MEVLSLYAGLLLAPVVAALFQTPAPGNLFDVEIRRLAEVWAGERISPRDPLALTHAGLKAQIESLATRHPGVLRAEIAGASAEGRDILLVSAGRGADAILFWSQMHGDEPTATGALIDLLAFLGRHEREPWVARILDQYTLLCIPMLNPDGAERSQRRNAQNIDINRDARALQSPEGRLLKSIRDRHRPFLGFNLHNQNSLTTVGDTGRVATIALLAVAADVPQAQTGPGEPDNRRLLTKRVTAVLHEALSPFVRGHISRYDEAFNPRAFGDNMTLWGTPTVLIESGGHGPEQAPDFTVMLNFVGILAALDSLASGKIINADPAVFDSLKMNSETPIFDLLLQNAQILTGSGLPPFRGDVAVRRDLRAGGGSEALISEMGDLGVFTAHRTLNCDGALLTPGLIAWDPDRSFGQDSTDDRKYLRAGVTTLLETLSWERGAGTPPAGPTGCRLVNWTFLVRAVPSRGTGWELRLAKWLAAGGRACVMATGADAETAQASSEVAGWFGVESMSAEQAKRWSLPLSLDGDPTATLPRWTSEAARRFRIPRRGTISLGSVADLVLWEPKSSDEAGDMRGLRPRLVILNGREIHPEDPEPHGRFLPR